VFGVLEALILGSIAFGAALAPVLLDVAGVEGALIATGALLPTLVLLTWPALRRIDAAAPVAAEEIALLRGVPIFAPLAAVELERRAGAMTPVHATAGEELTRRGDPGDRLYVIVSGAVEVVIDGRIVARQEPGDHFGEIALLRDTPRTATVRALEATELRALPRDAFLAAVAGSEQGAAAAESVAAARLARGRPALMV
jgi:cyclic nucleotide-binding protein